MAPFVPRQRKRRVLDRQRAQKRQNQLAKNGVDGEDGGDANAVEILPAEEEARLVKKRELREAIRSEQPGMSGKKRKRLDKYIVGHHDFISCDILSFFWNISPFLPENEKWAVFE